MSSVNTEFLELLRQAGYSRTNPRTAVFNIFKESEEALSMKQLLQRAQNVDSVSVYRTVALFEKLAILQRINIAGKYRFELTDKFAEHHHHLACRGCQQVTEISEQTLESFIQKIAAQYNFVAQTHQVEIEGLCQACSRGGIIKT